MTTSHLPAPRATDRLPGWRRPLVVVAHPDDESFGLGAVLTSFVQAGAAPSVLCFTHGEASTLHGVTGDLREIRARELAAAAALLGLADVELRDEADGGLPQAPRARLAEAIHRKARDGGTDGLLVFDLTGITGHPDHVTASSVAIEVATDLGLPVLGWTLPEQVAVDLAARFGAPFRGRRAEEIDLVVPVSRELQREAVQAHPSQAVPGSALWRRLELLGDWEYLVWLVRPAA